MQKRAEERQPNFDLCSETCFRQHAECPTSHAEGKIPSFTNKGFHISKFRTKEFAPKSGRQVIQLKGGVYVPKYPKDIDTPPANVGRQREPVPPRGEKKEKGPRNHVRPDKQGPEATEL